MIWRFCEAREPCLVDGSQIRCDLCERAVKGAVPWALEQISALLGALDKHACGASQTEIRGLPDGMFHYLRLRLGRGLARSWCYTHRPCRQPS